MHQNRGMRRVRGFIREGEKGFINLRGELKLENPP